MPKVPRVSHAYMTQAAVPYSFQAQTQEPKANKKWTPEDDVKLLAAKATGQKWEPLARQYFPDKSATACRKRYERAMRAQISEEWGGEKREQFAQAYNKHKEMMWTTIAEELGEPKKDWKMFEAKAFELGLKGLEVVERTAKRNAERDLENAQAQDDSGLGFSDAEHEVPNYEVGPVVQGPHGYQVPAFQHHPYQQHHGYSPRGRLSVHSMLSPSPSAAGRV